MIEILLAVINLGDALVLNKLKPVFALFAVAIVEVLFAVVDLGEALVVD